MAEPTGSTAPTFNLGDRVTIRLSGGMKGRIVEWRGPLGPGGSQIYRVQYRRKPRPAYVEVREDQLIRLPPKARDQKAQTTEPQQRDRE